MLGTKRIFPLFQRYGAAWRPWLELFRLPNLFTAPGDALAGLALALTCRPQSNQNAGGLLLAVCTILLYAYGLADNDICDLQEDSRLRPERPLPSHRITPSQAKTVAISYLVAALLLALLCPQPAQLTFLVLAFLIHNYNSLLKKNRLRGSLAMGSCRGLSFLAGVAVAGWDFRLLPALLWTTGFIAAVTWLAEDENRTTTHSRATMLPALFLTAGGLLQLLFLFPALRRNQAFFLALGILAFCCAVVISWLTALRLRQSGQVAPQTMRHAIGAYLGCLLPWQASWLLLTAFPWAHAWGLLLLLAIPLTHFLRKRIAAS